MTLFESVLAAVILAVASVACLGATQGALRLQSRSVAWQEAVAGAEAALASEHVGAPDPSGSSVVRRQRWNDELDVLVVEMPVSGGGSYQLARLVERLQ